MKFLLKTQLLVAFLLVSQLGFSQTETLDYTLTSEFVNVAGINTSMPSTLIKSGNIFTWNQVNAEGVESTIFNITNTTENWNQENNIGAITYDMTDDGFQAQLTLNSQESGTFEATLTFIISETQQEHYIFNINTITYQ